MPRRSDDRRPGSERPRQRRQRLSFTTEQWVPFPVDRVFAFFADPLNLPRLMPAWQDARIDSLELQTPEGGQVPRGGPWLAHPARASARCRFRRIRLRWLALIDEYLVDHHFCDLQVTGPFGYWRHCHLVSAEMHGEVERHAGHRCSGLRMAGRRRLSSAIDVLGGRLQIRQLFHYRQRSSCGCCAKRP